MRKMAAKKSEVITVADTIVATPKAMKTSRFLGGATASICTNIIFKIAVLCMI